MKCLLVYDITDDRIRSKVADICLDYGLERIQYSAFWGSLNRNLQEELMLKVRRRLGRKEGDVRLFPLCKKDLAQRLEIHNAASAESAKGEVLSRAQPAKGEA